MELRIGTRGSKLALLQTQRVVKKLEKEVPDIEVEVKVIRTAGDLRHGRAGFGMFVNEINRAVLRGDIDIGVHSLKDLPTRLPKGLELACVPERLDPNDALISRSGVNLYNLPQRSVIGTSSSRRKAEIFHLRPDLKTRKIRGNIDTRIKKMKDGFYDAVVISWAALERLGLWKEAAQKFTFEEMVPAVGQGAIGVVCKKGGVHFLDKINDELAWREVTCERAFLAELGVGCRACAGAVAKTGSGTIELTAMVHVGGRVLLKLKGRDPTELGKKAGRMLWRAKST